MRHFQDFQGSRMNFDCALMRIAIESADIARRLVKAHEPVNECDFAKGLVNGAIGISFLQPINADRHGRTEQGPRALNLR